MDWIRQQTAVQCTEDSTDSTPEETQLPDEICRRAMAGEHEDLDVSHRDPSFLLSHVFPYTVLVDVPIENRQGESIELGRR